jgi:PleD family two-component response regulator
MESVQPAWDTPIRVLVSLGDESLRRSTEEELFHHGAKIYAFEDGGKIVSVAGAVQFDLILVDYALPEVSGPEVVEAVRDSGGANAFVPIWGVLPEKQEEASNRFLDAGANDVVVYDDLIDRCTNAVSLFGNALNHVERAGWGE